MATYVGSSGGSRGGFSVFDVLNWIDRTAEINKEKADEVALKNWAAGGGETPMPEFKSRALRSMSADELFRMGLQNTMAQQTARDVNTFGQWQGFNQMRPQLGEANPVGIAGMTGALAMGGMPMAQPSTITPPAMPFPALGSPAGQQVSLNYMMNQLPLTPIQQAQLAETQARTQYAQANTRALASPTAIRRERLREGNEYGLPAGSVVQFDKDDKMSILWKPEQEKNWEDKLEYWQNIMQKTYKTGPLGEILGELSPGMGGVNIRAQDQLKRLLDMPEAKPVWMTDQDGVIHIVLPEAVMKQLAGGWMFAPKRSQTTGDAGVAAAAPGDAAAEPQTVEEFIRTVQGMADEEQARAYYNQWAGKFQ